MRKLTFLLTALFILALNANASTSTSADPNYQSLSVKTDIRLTDQENVLVFMDVLPWEETAIQTVLDSLAVTYSVATSGEMGTIDLTLFDVVIIASDQPQSYYDAFDVNLGRFENYINQAGILEFHGCDDGWETGFWNVIPGGVTHVWNGADYNYVTEPDHPIVTGLPDTLEGGYASHDYFTTMTPDAIVITIDSETGEPTTIEYEWGAGKIIATCITLEIGYGYGWSVGGCLPNMIAYCLSLSGGPQTSLNLHPINPPIIIPAGGGTFDYRIEIMNFSDSTAICDVWANVLLPNGTLYGPLFDPVYFTLQPGFSAARIRTQGVPATAPAGIYSYIWYIGTYSYTIYDSASFDFEKLAMGDGSDTDGWWSRNDPANVQNWFITEVTEAGLLIHSAQPNPFNPTTTIAYMLPTAAKVNLSVYDISGRSIMTLVNGWQTEGLKEAVLDGSGLSSGIYIYRFHIGESVTSGKIVLVK